MSEFYLNLPKQRKTSEQYCECCLKPYQTAYRQQRYCNDPCKPLTSKERREGITDAVRRGEEEATPNPDYGNTRRDRAVVRVRAEESLGDTSRKWLSMRL